MASKRRAYHIRFPWCAARARFALWRTGRRPTEHALAVGLGVVVFADNAQRALPRAVGLGSSSSKPGQVGGCGFSTSQHLLRLPCCTTHARIATSRTGRRLTEHTRAGELGVVVFATNARHAPPYAVGRGFSSSTLRRVGGCGFGTPCLQYSGPWCAARARFAPCRTGRRPTERSLTDFAWLSLRPPRNALRPVALAEALLHRNRAKSAAADSQQSGHRMRSPWRAARARFAPSRTGRRSTEHVRAGGLGVVDFAANACNAPPYAAGRGSSSPTPRQVGGHGFQTL